MAIPTVLPSKMDRLLYGHAAIYMLGRLLPAVLTVSIVPILVRLMGASDYGTYALYSALALTTGNASGTYLAQPLLRYGHRVKEISAANYKHVLRQGQKEAALIAGTVSAIGGLFLPFNPASYLSCILMASTGSAFAIGFADTQLALGSKQASKAEIVRTAISVVLPLVLILSLPIAHPSMILISAAIGNLAGTALLGGAPGTETYVRSKESKRLLRIFRRYGIPIALWMVLSLLLNLSDRYIIEATLGATSAGVYSAIYDIVYKGVIFVTTPIIMAVHPMMMIAWSKKNRHAAVRLGRQAAFGIAMVGALSVFAVALLSPQIAKIVLGAEAVAVPHPVHLSSAIAGGAVLWQAGIILQKPIEMRGDISLMIICVALALLANVVLNIGLIPTYGIVAASYSTLISSAIYVVSITMAGWWLRRH